MAHDYDGSWGREILAQKREGQQRKANNSHIMLRCPHCEKSYEAEIGNNPLVKDGLTITPLPIEIKEGSELEQ